MIAAGEEELQKLTARLGTTVKKFRLEINTNRSKMLVNSRQAHQPSCININKSPLELVDHFKYLGAIVTTKECKGPWWCQW